MTITPAMAMANKTSQPEPLKRRVTNDRDMAVSFTSEPDEIGEVLRGGELRTPVSIAIRNRECKKIRTRGKRRCGWGRTVPVLPESRKWGSHRSTPATRIVAEF